MNNPQIQIFPYDKLPQSVLDELQPWYQQLILYDPVYAHVQEWAPADWQLLIFDGDQWASTVEVFCRTITVAGQGVEVGGISGVMTHPDYQRRGYSKRLMRRAVKWIAEQWTVSFGLLVCKTNLIPFYSELGWEQVVGKITFQQPDKYSGFDPQQVHGMIYRFGTAVWAGGDIDLCGLPW